VSHGPSPRARCEPRGSAAACWAQYVTTQRQDLAVIGLLAGGQRTAGQPWTLAALIEHARACDDAEVAALAVSTRGGLTMEDVAAIAASVTAPILRADLIVDPIQLYHARLHGIDAALFPGVGLGPSGLYDLVTVASSLHMASIIEVVSPDEVESALRLPHVLLGLRCTTDEGGLDVEGTRQLAGQAPRQCTVIVVPEVHSAAECTALRGLCDAAVVGDVLLDTADIGAALRAITGQ
jgi:indole-3-glycerol phosphate synthase